ncbi:MAG TPA: glycosyltransferase family 4 protein [Thermoanaerobaculia bacterium]|nr:glycosyltransferase family 4 protein [Thermoanaerobaculia bacterium]
MNLLCLCYEYPPIGGGGAPACEGLAEALVRQGHQVVVVTSKMKHLPAFERRQGVDIHRVRCLRRRAHHTTAFELATWCVTALRKATELVEEGHFDLIHAHFILPGGVVAHRLSRRSGLRYVLTAHGTDVPGYNAHRMGALHAILRPYWRTVVRGASAVTAPSRFLAELVRKPSGVEPVVIPNPADLQTATPRARHRRVLAVSRLLERKGVQHLIEVTPRLPPDWEVVVAGDGPYLPRLRRQAEQLGARVQFLGMVPREQLPELYASAEIFTLPSSRENFPMVLLEAMANGCAIVTTRGSGCEEVVGDGALLVRPGRPEELLDALTELIDNDVARRRLGDGSRQRVHQFSAPVVAAQFERLYKGIIAAPETTSDADAALA